jgi:alpha-beta hydrolase superfamily lysophospholipase
MAGGQHDEMTCRELVEVVTDYLEDRLPADGAILMAPAVWARDTQPWYQRTGLWLGLHLMPGAKVDADWVDVDPSDDPETLDYWEHHPLVIQRTRIDALEGMTALMDDALPASRRLRGPLLILYGGRDEVVPPEAICAMLRELPPAAEAGWRFAYYPEGWHFLTRDSRAAETVNDIRAWLGNVGADLPSGHELASRPAIDRLCD